MKKGVLRNDDIKFQYEFTEKFKEAYSINPKKTLRYMEQCVRELGFTVDENNSNKIAKLLFNEKTRVVLYFVIMFLCGLTFSSGIGLFIFGMIFFAAGVLLNLYDKNNNMGDIIFLFSHGLSGTVIMYFGASVENFDIIMSNETYMITYLLSLLLGAFGFFRIILYKLSSTKIPDKSNVFLYFVLSFIILAVLNIMINLGVILNV